MFRHHDQLEFDYGLAVETRKRTQKPERLIFMLFPPAQIAEQIAELARQQHELHQCRQKPLLTSRFHCSLHHIGDYRRLRSPPMFGAQRAAVLVKLPPFSVRFDHVQSLPGGRPGQRPLVMTGGSEALLELHRTLGAALTRMGLKAAPNFLPHVTLLYDPRFFPRQEIEPISWTVTDFHLIHSEKGLTRYNGHGCWRLTA